VRALVERHGTTYAEELWIDAARNTPAPLFQLLCAALLLSARIGFHVALDTARALSANGWTTPGKMARSTWGERAYVLNMAGYARYDERTSSQLGESCKLLLDRYGGDLRKLRAEAGFEPARERELLRQFRGIGDVGVDIFFREVQTAWQELVPFAARGASGCPTTPPASTPSRTKRAGRASWPPSRAPSSSALTTRCSKQRRGSGPVPRGHRARCPAWPRRLELRRQLPKTRSHALVKTSCDQGRTSIAQGFPLWPSPF
jgi:hypothetical protein